MCLRGQVLIKNHNGELEILASLFLSVSLDSIVMDVRSLEKGMEAIRQELQEKLNSPVLRDFLSNNSTRMETLIRDAQTAQVRRTIKTRPKRLSNYFYYRAKHPRT